MTCQKTHKSETILAKTAIVSIAALVAVTLAGVAKAQSIDVDAGIATDVTQETNGPDPDSTGNLNAGDDMSDHGSDGVADTGAQGNDLTRHSAGDGGYVFDEIVTLNADTELNGTFDAASVAFADIDNDLSANARSNLKSHLDENASVVDLRNKVAANAELSNALDFHGFDEEVVAAVEIKDDGTTVVYVADGAAGVTCGPSTAGVHRWAEIEDIEAATQADVFIAEDCLADILWVNADIQNAADSNEMIAAKLRELGYVSGDIIGMGLISQGHVSIFVGKRR